jgi:hypothetical protein
MSHKHFCISDFSTIRQVLPVFFHLQMTQLAKACINRDPKQRPTMRSVVVSLMTLNSTISDGTDSTSLSLTMEHDSN